jgi:hypothetical protein
VRTSWKSFLSTLAFADVATSTSVSAHFIKNAIPRFLFILKSKSSSVTAVSAAVMFSIS